MLTLWKTIRENMIKRPQTTVSENDFEMTYADIIRYVESVAPLLGNGIHIVRCQSEMKTGIALLCCMAAGVTAVPLSERYGEKHCQRIEETVSASYLITDKDCGCFLAVRKLSGEPMPTELTGSGTERTALILYTSGTTGIPKGAMLTEKNLLADLDGICRYFAAGETDSILITRPLYHGAVLTGEFLLALLKGMHIVFYPKEFNPTEWLDILLQKKISVMGGTPTLFSLFSRFSKRSDKAHSLRNLIVSGEKLTRSVAERIRAAFPKADIYSVYGLTEASPRVSYLPPHLFDEVPESAGIPISGVRLKLDDGNGKEPESGSPGELCVAGDNVMKGYFQNPDATKRVLRDGWLHTGDMAYRDERGLLFVCGRKDDMILHAGINIYPCEIENELLRIPGVREALAFGIPDEICGQRIGVRVVGDNLSVDAILNFCRKHLPPYEVPSEVEISDCLPHNGSGKLVRKRL